MPYPRETPSKHSLNAPGQTMEGVSRRQTGTHGPPTDQTFLQTFRFLGGQLTVYTDGSATAGTKDGGAGVIVTCGDPADFTILHRSHVRGAAFTSSFAEEAAATCIGMDHRQPTRALTHNLHRQSIAVQGNRTSVSSNPPPKTSRQRTTGPDIPAVDTRAQRKVKVQFRGI